MKKVDLAGTPWNPQWDQIIEKALPAGMLSSRAPIAYVDSAAIYEMSETDKRTFWALWFAKTRSS
jgi:hypothetical protein